MLVCVTALLYLLTLDNGLAPEELVGGDLITHQYAQVQARPSNAPGYPIYTMGGWLWYHGGRMVANLVGRADLNPVPLLSSYSTLWALLAIWLLYHVLRFITGTRFRHSSDWGDTGNWPLAFLLSAFYAVTYFFWYYATTTEQYTSAVAQSLAMLLVYLHWSAADADAGEMYGVNSRAGLLLVALAFLNGLSLAHMLTVALMTPPMLFVVLWQRPAILRRPGLLAAVLGAAALPLLAYLYVWIRGSTHPEWWGAGEWETARAWFWSFLSTAQGRDELSWGLEAGRPFFGGGFPGLVARELSVPLVLAGLAGVAALRRRTAVLVYATLGLYAAFCWFYRFGNWYQVALPAYPLLLVGAGALINLAQERRAPAPARRWLHAAVYVGLLGIIAWRASASLPDTDSRNRPSDSALDRAALLASSAPQGAALFAAVEDTLALDYLISIWSLRPDLVLVTSLEAHNALVSGRPVVSTWESVATLLSEIDAGRQPLRLATVNPDWVQVLESDVTPLTRVAASSEPVDLLTGSLTLAAWHARPSPDGAPVAKADKALDVWLHWNAPSGWPAGVSFSLRPTVAGELVPLPGGVIVQVDRSAPMQGFADLSTDPTRPVDALRLTLPDNLATEVDGFALILYRALDGGFETLAEVPLALRSGDGE